MDFAWSPGESELFEEMRALGARAKDAPPDERLDVLARGGALGLCLPADEGGGGHRFVTTAGAYEALGETLDDGGTLLAAGAHLFGVACTVAAIGTADQRALLPRLASGELIATVAATEIDAGSDVAEVATSVRDAGAGLEVTGHKRYVTCAARAGAFLVVCRDESLERGLTTLVVERPSGSKGVVVGDRLDTAGLRGAQLAPVTFERCFAPPGACLGKRGAGLAVFTTAMTFERALVLAFRLGAMKRQLDDAVRFAKRRRVGGTPIAKHQAVSHRVARMQLRLETARLMIYRAAWELDQSRRGQATAALAKWHVADAAVASALDHLALLGGAGYLEETGAMSALDDTLGGAIHSGTGDVLAGIVARWLGL